MRTGVVIMALGFGMSLVVMHVGLVLSLTGTALARPALHRLPGFWWAAAYVGWQALSILASISASGEPWNQRGYGQTFTWIAMYLAAEAFRDAWVRTWAVVAMSAVSMVSMGLALVQFTIGLVARRHCGFRLRGFTEPAQDSFPSISPRVS